MNHQKLCLGVLCLKNSDIEADPEKQLALIRKAGFDAFFTDWDEKVYDYRTFADRLGLTYQSIHAPFLNAAKMWEDGDASRDAVNELISCVRDCAAVQVPIMIVHAYIGFDTPAHTNMSGIENFRAVVEEAASRGVKIAFENVEGEEYLAALMQAFDKYDNVGFCWDTGHELCYNRGKDMMALYGDRLFGTHLNDNFGIRDPKGKELTPRDDLHLLPFDGAVDWNSVAQRLNKFGYQDFLTFELSRNNKEEYHNMTPEEYVAAAYERACRLADLKERDAEQQAKQ